MKNCCGRVIIGCLLFSSVVCITSCEKPLPEGKLAVASQEFAVRQDNEKSYTIDAKGKIENIGAVDVKNVVVTGYCRSCGEEWIPGRWFVGAEKTAEQKTVIPFLPAGKDVTFGFTGVADMYLQAGGEPPTLPDSLDVVIESFEVVEEK